MLHHLGEEGGQGLEDRLWKAPLAGWPRSWPTRAISGQNWREEVAGVPLSSLETAYRRRKENGLPWKEIMVIKECER